MKLFRITLIALTFTGLFTACQKDETKNSLTIDGTWRGMIGTDNHQPDNYFCVLLNKDGSLLRLTSDGSVVARGNWQVNENSLTGNYQFPDGTAISFTSAIVKEEHKLNGTWINNRNDSGAMFASKEIINN